VNAARLQQLESRIESSVKQQHNWLLEKNALLDCIQELSSRVEQQAIALEEQRSRHEADVQQMQSVKQRAQHLCSP
jgi:hypothetical protein